MKNSVSYRFVHVIHFKRSLEFWSWWSIAGWDSNAAVKAVRERESPYSEAGATTHWTASSSLCWPCQWERPICSYSWWDWSPGKHVKVFRSCLMQIYAYISFGSSSSVMEIDWIRTLLVPNISMSAFVLWSHLTQTPFVFTDKSLLWNWTESANQIQGWSNWWNS